MNVNNFTVEEQLEYNETLKEAILNYIEDNNLSDKFEGTDMSLDESLNEYDFIYSKELQIYIYVNEYLCVTIGYGQSEEQIIEAYKYNLDCMSEDNQLGFLDWCNYEHEDDMTHLPHVFLDWNSYFGISDSPFSSYYSCNYESVDECIEDLKRAINKQK